MLIIRVRIAGSWLGFTLAAAACCLATPSFIEGFVFPFYLVNMQDLQAIEEWSPASFGSLSSLEAVIIATIFVLVYKRVQVAPVRLALLLILVFSLAVLYRFGPSRNRPQWRWVSPGGLLAALLWLGASALFSYYVGHFGSYDKTYGSLGAAIGFMTWIWISTIVVLLGAELNAEMERQTLEDTTVGGNKPLGARRARAADTFGGSTA